MATSRSWDSQGEGFVHTASTLVAAPVMERPSAGAAANALLAPSAAMDPLSGLLSRLGLDVRERTTSFPMEAFLMMGENYTSDPALGRAAVDGD